MTDENPQQAEGKEPCDLKDIHVPHPFRIRISEWRWTGIKNCPGVWPAAPQAVAEYHLMCQSHGHAKGTIMLRFKEPEPARERLAEERKAARDADRWFVDKVTTERMDW
jgi:hypothetical protein